MDRSGDLKIILVTRLTRLESLVYRFNTIGQARFYIEHLGVDFSDYELENDTYRRAVKTTEEVLRRYGRVQTIERAFLPNFIFGPDDLVVVLGQDGLVANALKYLKNHPVIAVNPDPARFDGVLLPFGVADIEKIVRDCLDAKRKLREITMAKAELNSGQALYAVNDLFIGQKTHTSARYELKVAGATERQSSSGIIVSTGLGSTGWLKSVIAGASGIGRAFEKDFSVNALADFKWESDYLYYSVREPFPSKVSSVRLVFGKIAIDKPMEVISAMPENGVIFSDGIEADFLEFASGTKAVIKVAKEKGMLVV